MRMFLSVSGHSSELSIANHSSRPTVSQLNCVSDTLSNWFENHQPQKTKISTVIYATFNQNSNQMASRLTATTSFPTVFFQLLQFSRQRPSFSAHRATPKTNTNCFFQHFLQDSLLRTVTNEIASFCIDNRSRQMAFFSSSPKWAKAGPEKAGIRVMLKYFKIKICFSLLDSMLPCVCSVIDHRWRKNVVRTKEWRTRGSRVCHWCSYQILTSSMIYYW